MVIALEYDDVDDVSDSIKSAADIDSLVCSSALFPVVDLDMRRSSLTNTFLYRSTSLTSGTSSLSKNCGNHCTRMQLLLLDKVLIVLLLLVLSGDGKNGSNDEELVVGELFFLSMSERVGI